MSRIVMGALATVLGASGCGGGEPSAYDLLAGEAETARELELYQGLPVQVLSQEEYGAMQASQAGEMTDEAVADLRATWGKLGYFDASLDLRATFGGASSWVAGTYNSAYNMITIVGDPGDDVIVHEMVHGLQDQHFDLVKYRTADTTDAFFARRAVIEGDATLAQSRYIMRTKFDADLDHLRYHDWFEALLQSSQDYLADSPYPPYFRAALAFVYSHGTIFCAHNLTGATPEAPLPTQGFPFDWGREDGLFTTPAANTKQILEMSATGGAVEIGLDDVPEELSAELTATDWDTLGAWHSFLLFFPYFGADDQEGGKAFARAWQGDRALFVKDAASGERGVVWASVWEDEAAAETAADALRTVHGFTAADGSPFEGTAADGEAVWIEARGTRVAFVKDVRTELTAALVDAAIGPATKTMSAAAGPGVKIGAPLTGRPRSRPSLAEWVYRHTGGHL